MGSSGDIQHRMAPKSFVHCEKRKGNTLDILDANFPAQITIGGHRGKGRLVHNNGNCKQELFSVCENYHVINSFTCSLLKQGEHLS